MANASLTIKVGANVKDAAQQLQALGYNVETVKKKTDKANESSSLWQQTMKKGTEDNVRKIIELGAKYMTFTTIVAGAYKGVKSLVSAGLKENAEAQKKIDKINEAWTDIKTNLGTALLDTVTPALETLYKILTKISTWANSVQLGATYNKMIDKARNNGGTVDFSGYTYEELRYALGNIYDNHDYKLGKGWANTFVNGLLDAVANYDVGIDGGVGESAGSGESAESRRAKLDKLEEERRKESQEAWKEYYNSIVSYSASAYSSIISLENQLWENEIQRIEDSEMSEEEKAEKINALEKKQFEAEQRNSLAQIAISYAEGVMKIWKEQAGNILTAAPLIGLLSVASGAQAAAVMSQQYTPSMAVGGIVSQPTHALIGEGGEKEAVIPLSKLEEYVTPAQSGNIYLTVNCSGNASETDVYYAIERAQRTGLLPHWRYA